MVVIGRSNGPRRTRSRIRRTALIFAFIVGGIYGASSMSVVRTADHLDRELGVTVRRAADASCLMYLVLVGTWMSGAWLI